jgi:predicted lipid-binding transport protein (Tim44 family)
MNSDNFVKRVIVNGLKGSLLGALVLGLLGLLLGGVDGMIAGSTLGGAIGLLGGFMSIAYIENAAWYKGIITRYDKKRDSELDE